MIGIISPIAEKQRTSGIILSHLALILDRVNHGNLLIIGGNVDASDYDPFTIHTVKYIKSKLLIYRVVNFCHLQAIISCQILKLRSKVDSWVFFVGGSTLLMPVLITKLLRKRSILMIIGSMEIECKLHPYIFCDLMIIFKNINLYLVNRIVVYSPILIEQWNLEKYRNKISIARDHFLNFDEFKIKTYVYERNNLVGYIGRLSEEKGALNFAKSILMLSEGTSELNFLIGGDGRQHDIIRTYIQESGLSNVVKLVGWIPHNELPDYLNRLRLIVMPSYTEGLPNIMLEAMACGTPVLATPVGAIPDIIKDGETGFLMEDNSPECITANVIRALEHPDFEGVAERGRALVEREFSFDRATEGWRMVLEETCDEGDGQ